MRIGDHVFRALILAPMAGISDSPFRRLCRAAGAGLAVSEMVSSKPELLARSRTRAKTEVLEDPAPRSVQILGADPKQMADAAAYCVSRGAQIIDINMGCPAKKVCNVAAGSALLQDEPLVERILASVVARVDVPVTVKIRTGWDLVNRNAVRIAQIAERVGIAAITVHGRTRACGFGGSAEYETIRAVKRTVTIPVIANGDIDSPEKARRVLLETQADALMIGRGALGRPWLFKQIANHLADGTLTPAPAHIEILEILITHLHALYGFYGDVMGVRIARKHIKWYLSHLQICDESIIKRINQAEEPANQLASIEQVFHYGKGVLAA